MTNIYLLHIYDRDTICEFYFQPNKFISNNLKNGKIQSYNATVLL